MVCEKDSNKLLIIVKCIWKKDENEIKIILFLEYNVYMYIRFWKL